MRAYVEEPTAYDIPTNYVGGCIIATWTSLPYRRFVDGMGSVKNKSTQCVLDITLALDMSPIRLPLG